MIDYTFSSRWHVLLIKNKVINRLSPFKHIYDSFPGPTPCTRSIDLGVILDATNSVGRIHFNIAKTFALALVNSMKIAPGGSHLGLMVYNIYPKLLVRFNEKEKQHPAVVKSILHQETKLGGRTFTDRAIKAAATDLFTLKDGDRPDKQDVLVLVTDGRTNVASEPYEKVLQPLKVGRFIISR